MNKYPFFLLILGFLLCACTSAAVTQDAATLQPALTQKLSATLTATNPPPTETPSPTPTATPVKITLANAENLVSGDIIGLGTVNYTVWSQDSESLVIAGSTGFRTYHLATDANNLLAPTTFHPKRFALSSDQQIVVTADENKVLVIQLETGQVLQTLGDGTFDITSVAISPDNSQVAAGGQDGKVRLYDRSAGSLLQTLSMYGSVNSLAFSPDGARILAGGARGNQGDARIWRVKDGQILAVFDKHLDWVSSVAFSPDGSLVISGSGGGAGDDAIRAWDSTSGKQVFSIQTESAVSSLAFSSDGQFILAGLWRSGVGVWDLEGKAVRTLGTSLPGVRNISISMDGKRVSAVTTDTTVSILDFSTGTELQAITTFGAPIDHLTSLEYGSLAASTQPYILVISPTGEQTRLTPDQEAKFLHVSASPDGQFFVATSYKGLTIVKANKGWVLQRLGGPFHRAVFSPDGKLLAAVITNSTEGFKSSAHIELFETTTWNRVRTWKIHQNPDGGSNYVHGLAFSPDGSFLATSANLGTIQLWRVDNGELIQTIDAKHVLSHVSISPDGSLVASTSHFPFLTEIWRTDDGSLACKLDGTNRATAFSPDGHLLVSGYGNSLMLWDVQNCAPIKELAGHNELVTSVVFAPDQTWIASASLDGTIRTWMLPK